MPKKLDVRKIRFAVEVEVEYPSEELSSRLIEKCRTLRGWDIIHDFSLSKGCEMKPSDKNHLYWNKDTKDQLKEIIAIVKCHKGRANKHTGLHVHVNISNLTDAQILNIIKNFAKEQNAIIKKFKVYPARLKEMCRKLDPKQVAALTELDIKKYRMLYGGTRFHHFNPYLTDKYTALNSNHIEKNGYQTLEFRLFNGTLDMKKLLAAIWFSITFVKKHANSVKP